MKNDFFFLKQVIQIQMRVHQTSFDIIYGNSVAKKPHHFHIHNNMEPFLRFLKILWRSNNKQGELKNPDCNMFYQTVIHETVIQPVDIIFADFQHVAQG